MQFLFYLNQCQSLPHRSRLPWLFYETKAEFRGTSLVLWCEEENRKSKLFGLKKASKKKSAFFFRGLSGGTGPKHRSQETPVRRSLAVSMLVSKERNDTLLFKDQLTSDDVAFCRFAWIFIFQLRIRLLNPSQLTIHNYDSLSKSYMQIVIYWWLINLSRGIIKHFTITVIA